MTIQASLRILELDQAHHPDQVHRAYRRQVKRWHPDQFAHQPAMYAQAEERLKRINHAYSILKEHLKKYPSGVMKHTGPSGDKPEKTNKAPHSKKPESGEPFQWRRWFKSKNPKKRKNNDKAKDTAKATNGFKRDGNATAARKRPTFEKVLHKAAGGPHKPPTGKRTGARPLYHPDLYKRRKKGMRVEGFRPVSPITPVSPVSKVSRIEGSD